MSDLPRVTEVIKAAGLLPPYPENGNYLEKGTATDLGCQLLFKGHNLGDLEVDERIIGYLQSLDLWLLHTGFKAKHIQQEVFNSDYIGHVDADNPDLTVDTKTGSPAKWHAIQTAAYHHLTKSKRRGSLYLQPDGSMAKFKEHTDRADWNVFLSALRLFQGEKALEQYRENIKRWMEA